MEESGATLSKITVGLLGVVVALLGIMTVVLLKQYHDGLRPCKQLNWHGLNSDAESDCRLRMLRSMAENGSASEYEAAYGGEAELPEVKID